MLIFQILLVKWTGFERKKKSLTVLLFCLTGGSAGGLLAKPTELIVVPMTTCLGLGFGNVPFSNFFLKLKKKQNGRPFSETDCKGNALHYDTAWKL